MRLFSVVSVAAALCLGATSPQDQSGTETCSYIVDLANSSHALLLALDSNTDINLKVEADLLMFVNAKDRMCRYLQDQPNVTSAGVVDLGKLYVVPAQNKLLGLPKKRTLISGGRFALVEMTRFVPKFYDGDDFRGTLQLVTGNRVLAKRWVATPQKVETEYRSEVVASFDQDSWLNDVKQLSSWNRNTSQPGVLQARDFIAKELEELGYSVSLPEFQVGSTKAYNVVAKMIGKTRPDDVYIVGAHYDSTSENTRKAAPGAEDNASGAAALLAMARTFSEFPPDATVLFVAFSGEEQGLIGSRDFVSKLAAAESASIKRVIVMDMIAYSQDDDLDCLLETHENNAAFVQELANAAAKFTKLRIVSSYDYWGSDHVPFINKNIPAVLTIENDYEKYPAYHRTTDTIENISLQMGAETIKMNIGALTAWVYDPKIQP